MFARGRRLLVILALATATGCEAMRTVFHAFTLGSQSKAIERVTDGSPNEKIQYEASQAQQKLEHRFD